MEALGLPVADVNEVGQIWDQSLKAAIRSAVERVLA